MGERKKRRKENRQRENCDLELDLSDLVHNFIVIWRLFSHKCIVFKSFFPTQK